MTTKLGNALEAQISETIRLLMTRTGTSQTDLGNALGVTRGSVSQKLLGNAAWRVGDIAVIADYYGITVCELVSGYAAIAQAGRLPDPGRTGQTIL